jgi:predicted RNA-binding protein with PIN domain
LSTLKNHDLEAARAALLAELGRYRKLKCHQVSAVFDGRKAHGLPLVSRRGQVGGVSVIFSRPGQEADDVIHEMARRYGMRAVVVTADAGLAASCQRWGAAVVSPAEFEGLLRAAGEDVEEAEPAPEGKKGPAKRPPREERRQRLRKRKL